MGLSSVFDSVVSPQLHISPELMPKARVRFSMYHKSTIICTYQYHKCNPYSAHAAGGMNKNVDCKYRKLLVCSLPHPPSKEWCCSVLEYFPFLAPAASRLNKNEPYAIAHLKLMKDDDTTIEDGPHELYVYKVS